MSTEVMHGAGLPDNGIFAARPAVGQNNADEAGLTPEVIPAYLESDGEVTIPFTTQARPGSARPGAPWIKIRSPA